MGISTANVDGIDVSKITGIPRVDPWGATRYVNSAHANASDSGKTGLNLLEPLATLVRAIAQSNAGDTIVIGPGHTETISAAGAITVALANVTIIGIGRGNQKPTFTFSTSTAGSILLSGAGLRLENLHFVTNIASLVLMLSMQIYQKFC